MDCIVQGVTKSRGSSRPRGQTLASFIAGIFFTTDSLRELQGKVPYILFCTKEKEVGAWDFKQK